MNIDEWNVGRIELTATGKLTARRTVDVYVKTLLVIILLFRLIKPVRFKFSQFVIS